jgi:hypothetical protein
MSAYLSNPCTTNGNGTVPSTIAVTLSGSAASAEVPIGHNQIVRIINPTAAQVVYMRFGPSGTNTCLSAPAGGLSDVPLKTNGEGEIWEMGFPNASICFNSAVAATIYITILTRN